MDRTMSATSVRSEIYRIVSSILPLDIIEQEHIDFVLTWLESGVDIFRTEKPATPKTHLVSYFVVVSPQMDRILLVDHKKARLWLPPGGHVEPNENPKDTVRREAQEELGLQAQFMYEHPIFLSVINTAGIQAKHTDVSLWYLIQADPEDPLDFDPREFNRIQWFGVEEIPFQHSDPYMKRFITKMLTQA